MVTHRICTYIPHIAKEDRTAGEWRRGGPLPGLDRRESSDRRVVSDDKVRDFDTWERRGPLPALDDDRRQNFGSRSSSGSRSNRDSAEPERENPRQFGNWRSGSASDGQRKTPEASDPPVRSERKRLALKPRSTPIDSDASASAATPATGSKKSSPFGLAAPVDTSKKLQELEERLAAKEAERQQKIQQDIEERKAAAKAAAERTERAIANRRQMREALATKDEDHKAAPAEEKKEESPVPSTKTFDILRTAAAADDDFVPDEEEEEVAPTSKVESAVPEGAPVQAAVEDSVEGGDWSVVEKPVKRVNGK